ncbi:MAG: D-ribose pyranase [Chloroflexota bacterium]|nr:D-ribose pyranase [Chloroflexota bacterium]
MRRGGILHPALGHLLSSLGHTDYFTICDQGFPIPTGPERIDLALVDNIPTVLDVVRAVHAEWSIDRVVIASEMIEFSHEFFQALRQALPEVPYEAVSHLELKRLARDSCGTVRTADTIPYSNLLLVSG